MGLRSCSSQVNHCLNDGQHPILTLVALGGRGLPLEGQGTVPLPLTVLWSESGKHCPSVEEQWGTHKAQAVPKPLLVGGWLGKGLFDFMPMTYCTQQPNEVERQRKSN